MQSNFACRVEFKLVNYRSPLLRVQPKFLGCHTQFSKPEVSNTVLRKEM